MCVWLRGDSEVDGFVMSAEEVMAALNIKRSRLTQISGRELRVGRRRVDRYIKPFYRQEDVFAYRAWTRASATKQKNAELVDRAAGEIEHRNKRLLTELQEQLQAYLKTELLAAQQQIIATCQHQYGVLCQQLQATQAQQIDTLSASLLRLYSSFRQTADKLALSIQAIRTSQEKTAADTSASTMHALHSQEQLLQSLHKIAAPQSALLTALPEQIHQHITAEFQQFVSDSIVNQTAQLSPRASIAPQPNTLRRSPLPRAAIPVANKRSGWCSINPTL